MRYLRADPDVEVVLRDGILLLEIPENF